MEDNCLKISYKDIILRDICKEDIKDYIKWFSTDTE